MSKRGAYKTGWLQAELEAAVKEVESWSAGMRRKSANGLQRELSTESDTQPAKHERKETAEVVRATRA